MLRTHKKIIFDTSSVVVQLVQQIIYANIWIVLQAIPRIGADCVENFHFRSTCPASNCFRFCDDKKRVPQKWILPIGLLSVYQGLGTSKLATMGLYQVYQVNQTIWWIVKAPCGKPSVLLILSKNKSNLCSNPLLYTDIIIILLLKWDPTL